MTDPSRTPARCTTRSYRWLPPIVVIVVLFLGLFGLAAGLDEWANPRLRKSV